MNKILVKEDLYTYVDLFDKPIEELISYLQELQKDYQKSWFEKSYDGTIEHYTKRIETDEEYEKRLAFELKILLNRKSRIASELEETNKRLEELKQYNL